MTDSQKPKLTVLLVDDDPDWLEIISQSFIREDFQTIKTTNAMAALKVLTSGAKIDVIVSDFKMPEKNGLELIEMTRRHGIHTPFFMLSASREITEKAVLDAGANGLFQKPVSSRSLVATVIKSLVCNAVASPATKAKPGPRG